MLYCKPIFGEGFLGRGMGFGGRLLPWARCRIFSQVHSAQMISPVWLRPAVMQIFRGGIDYNSYLRQLILLGLFQRRSGDLGVIEGLIKSRNSKTLTEDEFAHLSPSLLSDQEDINVVFSGYKPMFAPLNHWHDFLLTELKAITKPSYVSLADSFGEVPIGLCVRCGNDFPDPVMVDGRIGKGQKTPISWFVKSLLAIREKVGTSCKAVVVSDGTPDQLRELLSLENVSFVRPASAVSDLLVLSRSRVLIGSGSSMFVAWGSFLGQMPCISHPGQPFSEWSINPSKGQFMGEFDLSHPSENFLNQAKASLENQSSLS
jgi:hypothetical protein